MVTCNFAVVEFGGLAKFVKSSFWRVGIVTSPELVSTAKGVGKRYEADPVDQS